MSKIFLLKILSVVAFLLILNFFVFYWTDATGLITPKVEKYDLVAMIALISIIVGFVLLLVLAYKEGESSEGKIVDLFLIMGLVLSLLNFFVFFWLGFVAEVCVLSGEIAAFTVINFFQFAICFFSIFLLWRRARMGGWPEALSLHR